MGKKTRIRRIREEGGREVRRAGSLIGALLYSTSISEPVNRYSHFFRGIMNATGKKRARIRPPGHPNNGFLNVQTA